MSKSLKKIVEESREKNIPEVDMCDRGVSNMLDIPALFTLSNITQLVLSHNKLTTVPPNVADLKNLEVLNVFNNQIEDLPIQISSLQKLKHLNLGMNRLSTLPRGFGSLPALEVLDLTYNNLNESSLPGNFFYLTTLRALYLSDNDFEMLPPDISKLAKLQILSMRDNDLISLPKEIGDLAQLKELHIQGNRLTVLPPELGNLDLTGPKQVFKAENNPWVTPIADQFQLGVSHVFEYVRSETYKYLYGRHMQANPDPPKKSNDKTKKISRKPLAAKNKSATNLDPVDQARMSVSVCRSNSPFEQVIIRAGLSHLIVTGAFMEAVSLAFLSSVVYTERADLPPCESVGDRRRVGLSLVLGSCRAFTSTAVRFTQLSTRADALRSPDFQDVCDLRLLSLFIPPLADLFSVHGKVDVKSY
ncbi:hypothetical protein AAFF_G00124450 [Aldrovandia affinis]|uniref:Ras suppressor protein 1 n=1 Tax=Aldrovandia affinis TaxID=143900 RepID=A0AAD7RRG1_9TELE|nr:hypothetical protein AAFF_G00124450 [Aldrovandia affinis]